MRNFFRWLFLIVGIIGYALTIIIFLTPVTPSDRSPVLAPNIVVDEAVEAQMPSVEKILTSSDVLGMRLFIPRIKVNASIEVMTVDSRGTMTSPVNPKNVGVFQIPANSLPEDERGILVMDGHRGWQNGTAVFDNLHKLNIGDILYLTNESTGKKFLFVVRKTRLYGAKENPEEVFREKLGTTTLTDGITHLNLITCEGSWNPLKNSYSKRLVVFADKV